jgi:hypothetical protein
MRDRDRRCREPVVCEPGANKLESVRMGGNELGNLLLGQVLTISVGKSIAYVSKRTQE